MHFERLKPHHGGPTEWAAVIMDPDPEQSQEEVPDDALRPSYREKEPISEARNASLPSRQQHWMDTRLRTRMRAGGSRLHYQQFDYSSTDSGDERSDVLISSAQANPNENDILTLPKSEPAPILEIPTSPLPPMEALFSENEAAPDAKADTPDHPARALIDSAGTSLAGTSAPLLTNPSLTDMLSNFPIWPQIDGHYTPETRNSDAELPISDDEKEPLPVTTIPTTATTAVAKPTHAQERQPNRRPRGRPPGRAKPRASKLRDRPKEVNLKAREGVPEADHFGQYILAPKPALVPTAPLPWTPTRLLPVPQEPQIKRHF